MFVQNNNDQNSVTLLIFAYQKEAQVFIEKLKLSSHKLNLPARCNLKLFKNQEESLFLAITEEGVLNVTSGLPLLLSYLSEQKISLKIIVNLGLAGSLKSGLIKNQCYEISHALYQRGDPKKGLDLEFHTYQSMGPRGISCLTTDHRINNKGQAEILRTVGDIVDRELWAIAHFAHLFNIPWICAKVISDLPLDSGHPESLNICQVVKEEALKYSQILFDYYCQNFIQYQAQTHTQSDQIDQIFATFYFTESMKRLFISYFGSIKDNKEFLQKAIIQSQKSEIRPKEQAQYFLMLCHDYLNPHKAKLKRELEELQQGQKIINLKWSTDFEKIVIKSEIDDIKNIKQIQDELQTLYSSKIERLLNGEVFKEE